MKTQMYDIYLEQEKIATLDLSQEPWWQVDDQRYDIYRYSSVMINWGPEVQYEVVRPEGGYAAGGCSNHDGCGVTAPDAEWGIERVAENEFLLGEYIKLAVDRDKLSAEISGVEDRSLLPFIICGLCIVLDGG